MLRTAFVLVPILALAGCSCSESDPYDVDDAGGHDASTTDAAQIDAARIDATTIDAYVVNVDADLGTCGEPLELDPDPAAEARATTALAALDPSASLTWVANRGTFSSITGLAIPLPECDGSEDAYDALFEILEASPDLFQIDRDEWNPDSTYPCSAITENVDFLRIRRVAYGPYVMVNDVFTVAVERRAGVVTLFGFGGQYIPSSDATLVDAIEACADRPEEVVEAIVRATPFDYTHFAPPPADGCQPVGEGTYTAASNDTVTFDEETELLWDDAAPIRLRRLRSVTLELATANHTAELIQSDANCSIEGRRIGWIRIYDAVTGEIVSEIKTPVRGCIVC
ncbi:hypothetical protein [Sandaracinus amylolyticus]|uniref:hypothetical protein n=1 Tax=Sandaracinus amylolyticus TaxID=927083 RepID=UPI001F430DB1|nr:hypothetical protein [Sandaracinus amylolyticus]UJR86285.1 Hypothetical protein I5071_83690 [Sandaracinus amylolyticus]